MISLHFIVIALILLIPLTALLVFNKLLAKEKRREMADQQSLARRAAIDDDYWFDSK
jgi:hypothetical protein